MSSKRRLGQIVEKAHDNSNVGLAKKQNLLSDKRFKVGGNLLQARS